MLNLFNAFKADSVKQKALSPVLSKDFEAGISMALTFPLFSEY